MSPIPPITPICYMSPKSEAAAVEEAPPEAPSTVGQQRLLGEETAHFDFETKWRKAWFTVISFLLGALALGILLLLLRNLVLSQSLVPPP